MSSKKRSYSRLRATDSRQSSAGKSSERETKRQRSERSTSRISEQYTSAAVAAKVNVAVSSSGLGDRSSAALGGRSSSSLALSDWVVFSRECVRLRLVQSTEEVLTKEDILQMSADQWQYCTTATARDSHSPKKSTSSSSSLKSGKKRRRRSEEEMESESNGFFAPGFTHQIFAGERIFGYKQLRIAVFLSQPDLCIYVCIAFSDCKAREFRTDIQAILRKWIRSQSALTFSRRTFLKVAFDVDAEDDDYEEEEDDDEHYFDDSVDVEMAETVPVRGKKGKTQSATTSSSSSNSNSSSNSGGHSKAQSRSMSLSTSFPFDFPPGELQCEYWRTDATDTVYEIRVGSLGDLAMREYHSRLEFLILLFIESSSFIDNLDDVWKVVALFAKSKRTGAYQVLGYLTVYSFYAFPAGRRLRVSQVLILPPFQRSGHGFELLQHVHLMTRLCDDCSVSDADNGYPYIELNVEDPASGFQLLRDVCDVLNASRCLHIVEPMLFGSKSGHRSQLAAAGFSPSKNGNSSKKRKASVKKRKKDVSVELATVGLPETHPLNQPRPYLELSFGSLAWMRIPAMRKFEVRTPRQKLPKGIYTDGILRLATLMRITPEQSRKVYECLWYEGLDTNDAEECSAFRLSVKRRLLKMVQDTEGLSSYDDLALKTRLHSLYIEAEKGFEAVIQKKDVLLKLATAKKKTKVGSPAIRVYPRWLSQRVGGRKSLHECILHELQQA